jgi:hypothetical protein
MVEISSDTLRMAIILGVVLPGVGHMYLGQVKRGIKIVIALVLSGTISGVAFSYFVNVTNTGFDSTFVINLISPAISLIPLIVWVWQIRDLRRVIKRMTGHSIEELEPPHLEGESYSPKEISICPDCGKSINKNLQICDNCGFKL